MNKLTDFPMTTYRTLPRYANSDLGEYRNQLFNNKAPKVSGAAQVFGTLFHSFLLQAQTPTDVIPKMDKQLHTMREAALQNKFVRQVLETALIEQVQLWEDYQTGLPCKAQTDIWVSENELIVDIKTTSCRTYGEFLKSCEEYGYDRQAAFYLDGTPHAKRFVIIGVQKQAPFQVFYFEASACRGCIEGGRKKYQGLLRGIHREGFIPSSWKLNSSLV